MNINSAISIIKSVEGFCDKSTPCGEAWAFVLVLLNQGTKPTEQPAVKEETCKGWRYTVYGAEMVNPHNGCRFSSFQVDYCPTCGKRIEVVK